MRKKIIFSVFALVLVIGCIAGSIVYAQTAHQVVKGPKLIGIGHCGVNPPPEQYTAEPFRLLYADTGFKISNPNCNKTLNITYLAILDGNGTVVGEGTPQQWNETAWEETQVPEQLGPHEIWEFALVYFLGGAPPFTGDTPPFYTVEVSWSGNADRPLIGFCQPLFHMFSFDNYDPNLGFDEQVTSIQSGAWEEPMESFIR